MVEIKTDHKISGYECPECGNDEIELGQSFCQDCGEPIEWKEDELNYEYPECFKPEKDNPYPLCVGKDNPECEECQLHADWEPEDPYGVERR